MSGCPTGSAAAYENCGAPALGLYAYPGSVPITDDAQYAITAIRNKPPGAPSDFAAVCEAMLRARGLLYWKNNPGDCGSAPPVPGLSSGQLVGLSGTAASGVIGGLGAVGTISGVATLGIGSAVTLAVAGIEGIFAHHAQAVANEQTTICSVALYFNQLVTQLDNAVRSGTITPSQGIAYMKQVALQAINGLQSIVKVCNAACVYIGVLKAHTDFANYFYNSIYPATSISAGSPGGAPLYYGTPPGGVTASGNLATNNAPPPPTRALLSNTYAPVGPSANGTTAPPLTQNMRLPSGCSVVGGGPYGLYGPGVACPPDYLNLGYGQQTGQSAQYADVPSTTNWSMWAAVAAIVAAFVAVLSFAGRRGVTA